MSLRRSPWVVRPAISDSAVSYCGNFGATAIVKPPAEYIA
ncbi:hypothetical protein CNE_BB1p09440 (plasmid) [Cupriavidus necator N-1]|uniref:Uncharacterized protein n=1 Tax=Cupriavidus necator (strain ATCC 43291 / DSM 13513 / CCUG 52238 / LMG 8453 / N-1) TaxID=1042878 RepID=F8GUF2_CUPNN|nr:hypothetical protein CNE_BB1p09440 [Cupriavidus necator N-1]